MLKASVLAGTATANAMINYNKEQKQIDSQMANIMQTPGTLSIPPFIGSMMHTGNAFWHTNYLSPTSEKQVFNYFSSYGYIQNTIINSRKIWNRQKFNYLKIDPTYNHSKILEYTTSDDINPLFKPMEYSKNFIERLAAGIRVHKGGLQNVDIPDNYEIEEPNFLVVNYIYLNTSIISTTIDPNQWIELTKLLPEKIKFDGPTTNIIKEFEKINIILQPEHLFDETHRNSFEITEWNGESLTIECYFDIYGNTWKLPDGNYQYDQVPIINIPVQFNYFGNQHELNIIINSTHGFFCKSLAFDFYPTTTSGSFIDYKIYIYIPGGMNSYDISKFTDPFKLENLHKDENGIWCFNEINVEDSYESQSTSLNIQNITTSEWTINYYQNMDVTPEHEDTYTYEWITSDTVVIYLKTKVWLLKDATTPWQGITNLYVTINTKFTIKIL